MDFGVAGDKITVNGPLKLAGTIFPDTRAIEERLKILFKGKLIFVSASLHVSEENEILEAYKITKSHLPNLVLVMIPRSVELSKNTIKKAMCFSKSITVRNSYSQAAVKRTTGREAQTLKSLRNRKKDKRNK